MKLVERSLTEFIANLGYKPPCEVEQIVMQAKKICVREIQQQCVAECKKQLDDSALQAVYATDMIRYIGHSTSILHLKHSARIRNGTQCVQRNVKGLMTLEKPC